ncbi:phage portal protein [bacterium]|nr:phage portal protein [bacterium]
MPKWPQSLQAIRVSSPTHGLRKPLTKMDIVGKVISSWSRMVQAARHDPRKRRWVDAQLADTKLDVSSASRQSIAALSRWLCYNSAIVRGAIDTMTRNAIGAGIKCQARTKDEGWNKATEEWLAMWEGSCDVRGILTYQAMQQVATRTMLRDNEIFILLTDNGDGWPMLQMVEGHRCETPSYVKDDAKIFDGVRMNKFGRPLSYYIRTGINGDTFTEVQATDVILLAERDRADEVRSLSKLASCINLLLDRDEILDYEMLACKRAGQIGMAIESTTNSGPGFFNPTETDSTNLTTDNLFGGGALVNVPMGKTLREIKNDRPSQNLQQHMDQYIRAVASGLGVPYAYIWSPNELTGPSQRFVLAQAQRRFDEISDAVIEQMLKRVRKWALAKAIKRGDLTPPRGMAMWWEAVYHTPARTTIDAGRDSASAERGSDWQEIVNQKIAEQIYIKQKAQEAGLTMADIQITGAPVAPAAPISATPPAAPLPEDTTVQPQLEEAIEPVQASVPTTETFTMRDDPDFNLTPKEMNMVVKAIGIGAKPKTKKKK